VERGAAEAWEMRIGIFGAGAVGTYVGGRLVERGASVLFVGRERARSAALSAGISLEALDATSALIPPAKIEYTTDAQNLAACDVVLCAVKSAQTLDAGASLARVLGRRTLVVSLQNGLGNAAILRETLPGHVVLAGIVGFNVVLLENGTFRRATTGALVIEWSSDPRLAALAIDLREAGFVVELPKDIRAKQWSKLVMNLSNALSALSGVPTRALLFDPAYRRIMRAVVREANDVLRHARIEPSRMGPLPVFAFPYVLALPTPLLAIVARAQLTIDSEARSSMWQDLAKRRGTEVEELNGEIVRLAESSGVDAPLNRRLVALIHEAEASGAGSPGLSAAALWQKLTQT
jgi:2-dehydropantoate 2-reductase